MCFIHSKIISHENTWSLFWVHWRSEEVHSARTTVVSRMSKGLLSTRLVLDILILLGLLGDENAQLAWKPECQGTNHWCRCVDIGHRRPCGGEDVWLRWLNSDIFSCGRCLQIRKEVYKRRVRMIRVFQIKYINTFLNSTVLNLEMAASR